MTIAGDEERKNYIGGLVREQRLLLAIAGTACLVGCCLVWSGAVVLPPQTSLILVVGMLAALATLYREFFRLMLVSYAATL